MVPGHRSAIVAAPLRRPWIAARSMAACLGSVPLAALRAGQEDTARDPVTPGSGDSADDRARAAGKWKAIAHPAGDRTDLRSITGMGISRLSEGLRGARRISTDARPMASWGSPTVVRPGLR